MALSVLYGGGPPVRTKNPLMDTIVAIILVCLLILFLIGALSR